MRNMDLSTSVVLATYNGEKFILDQLESIRKQTIKVDEVLISDDGSTDDTVRIIENYISKHNLATNWYITQNKKNKGYAKNFFDTAIRASNNFIFFCDQDDIWELDKVEKMLDVLKENTDLNLLASDLELFYSSENALQWDKKDIEIMNNSGRIDKSKFSAKNFHCQRSGCTMCIRKSFLEIIAPYWKERWAQDDYVWKFAVLTDSCAIYHYKAIRRRMHSDNATNVKIRTRQKRVNQINDLIEYYLSCIQFIKDNKELIKDYANKESIIYKNRKSLDYRISTVKKQNFFAWIISALLYRDCYTWNKALFLDLYFVFFSSHKQ